MKTTIDIPDAILHRAKIVSAQRKTTLRALVMKGLMMELDGLHPSSDDSDPFLAALTVGHNSEPVGRLDREQLYDRQNLS
jgi:hypothetical protein